MKNKKATIDRIWDRYSSLGMSVCIIGRHNRRGEIDHYIIQKKKKGRLHSRQTVKVYNQYERFVDLEFETKDEALKRLDTQPVERMFVCDEIDFIVY